METYNIDLFARKRKNYSLDDFGTVETNTQIYLDIMNCFAFGLFKWDNLPNEITSEIMEREINTGLATFFKCESGVNAGLYVCKHCTPAGIVRENGTTDKYNVSLSDYTTTFNENSYNFAIGRNNAIFRNEYINMYRFAFQLGLIDVSQNAIIKWSKMHPIPTAFNDIQALKIESIIDDIEKGNKIHCVSDNSAIVTGNTKKNLDVINLTDVSAVEKLHFLSEYHTELIIRLCNMYNIPFRTNSKSSQSLNDELHDSDFFSQFYNSERLTYRKKFATEINNKFGLNVSVEYSDIIKDINKTIENSNDINSGENVSRETIEKRGE